MESLRGLTVEDTTCLQYGDIAVIISVISSSFTPGMRGSRRTEQGICADDNNFRACNRSTGEGACGSILLAQFVSNVVMDRDTVEDMVRKIGISLVMRLDFVTRRTFMPDSLRRGNIFVISLYFFSSGGYGSELFEILR